MKTEAADQEMSGFHGEARAYVDKHVTEKAGTASCARCGQAHASLDWKPLTNPRLSAPEGARPSAVIAFAMCPALDEPIFVEAWESPEDG